jgi:hypothetical protein
MATYGFWVITASIVPSISWRRVSGVSPCPMKITERSRRASFNARAMPSAPPPMF